MPLNEMSLQAMARLADDIDAVRAAMAILEDRGLSARASLLPGAPMRISVQQRMPEMFSKLEDPAPEFDRVSIAEAYRHAPVEDADPDKYARAAGLVDNEGFEVAPEATPITAEAPSKGKLDECALVSAPEPAVTGPGEAEQTAAPGPQPIWPARWTEQETAHLIEIMADRMERRGYGMRPAAEIAAEVLGRPVEGTLYKARSLVERIEAARRAVVGQVLDRLAPAGTSTDPGGVNQPVPEPLPEAAPQAVPGGDALTPFGELCRHLEKLPRKRGWTVERDHELLRLAELAWKPHEIALELAVPGDEIKPRFALLTGSGCWKRAEVLAALTQMLATEPTAA